MRIQRLTPTMTLTAGLVLFAAVVSAMPNGDFNGDGHVDLDDGAQFLECLLGPSDSQGVQCAAVDFDGDGHVDISDSAVFQNVFGMSAPTGMAIIPGGEFEMGCHAETGASCRNDQLPVHDVYANSFYMDVFLVTNAQYSAYLDAALAQGSIDDPDLHAGIVYDPANDIPFADTATSSSFSRIIWNGSTFGVTPGKEDHPMVTVSWYGAAAYANWRSAEDGRTPCYDPETWACDFEANGYRLPTEAEWEYAAREGEKTPYFAYPWGNAIDGSQANYFGSGDPFEGSSPQTTPVGYYDGGQTPAGVDMVSGFGMYDMVGNVSQWCFDRYRTDYYDVSPYDNPTGPTGGTNRILRGGSWFFVVAGLRSAFRARAGPHERFNDVGFRIVAGK